jgi:uncharacterized protein involved in exopolysaccharide biosynthesis
MKDSIRADETTSNRSQVEHEDSDSGRQISLIELLTWLGEGKRLIAVVTFAAAILSIAFSLTLTPIYTARSTLMPPTSSQGSGASAALAALGSLGTLGDNIGVPSKGPSGDLYVALLNSDSVIRALDKRVDLKARLGVDTFESLRKVFPKVTRATLEKKSGGVILLEVDDKDPKFAAELANAQVEEVTKLLDRLAVSEAQKRRVFFEQQLKESKENLIKAEIDMQRLQEKTGVLVLDKQTEALITGAARVRAQIAEREVQLKVLRTGTTEQNADVVRLRAEISALRSELARMESSQGGGTGSMVDIPMGKLPETSIEYVRARRELKLQEALLESMARQLEIAKVDEAREGPLLQQIDKAVPPDYKSKPSRAVLVVIATLLGLISSIAWVVARRFAALIREQNPEANTAWHAMKHAWRLRN